MYIMLQSRVPKFDAQVSALALKLKFIQFAVLVNNTISVLDSLWGKHNLVLFEHIKGHSSNKDKASINKLRSLWTHPHLSVELSLTCREALGAKRRRKTRLKVLLLLTFSSKALTAPRPSRVWSLSLHPSGHKQKHPGSAQHHHPHTNIHSLVREITLVFINTTGLQNRLRLAVWCGIYNTILEQGPQPTLPYQATEKTITTALAEHDLNLVY